MEKKITFIEENSGGLDRFREALRRGDPITLYDGFICSDVLTENDFRSVREEIVQSQAKVIGTHVCADEVRLIESSWKLFARPSKYSTIEDLSGAMISQIHSEEKKVRYTLRKRYGLKQSSILILKIR